MTHAILERRTDQLVTGGRREQRRPGFTAAGTNMAACVSQEWSPLGTELIQGRAFVVSPDELDIYLGDDAYPRRVRNS